MLGATMSKLTPGTISPFARVCRPLGHIVKCARILAPCEFGAAAPTEFHPRPSWAPDEIECRVLLMLPDTNLTPTLATSLRHTLTAEGQNQVVVLRHINVLTAAQTHRHADGASRTVGVIEQPVFGRGFLQLSHFTAGLERKRISLALACPRINRRRPPGVWVRAIWRARPSARSRVGVRT